MIFRRNAGKCRVKVCHNDTIVVTQVVPRPEIHMHGIHHAAQV